MGAHEYVGGTGETGSGLFLGAWDDSIAKYDEFSICDFPRDFKELSLTR